MQQLRKVHRKRRKKIRKIDIQSQAQALNIKVMIVTGINIKAQTRKLAHLELLLSLEDIQGHLQERRKEVKKAGIKRERKMKALRRIKIGTKIKTEKIKMMRRSLKKSKKGKWKGRDLKMRDKKKKDWKRRNGQELRRRKTERELRWKEKKRRRETRKRKKRWKESVLKQKEWKEWKRKEQKLND